jgi:hypothetical protein
MRTRPRTRPRTALIPAAGAIVLALVAGACAASTSTTAPTAATGSAAGSSTSQAPAPSGTAASTDPSAAATDAARSELPASSPDASGIFGSVDLLDSLDRYEITVEMAGSNGTSTMDVTTIREPVIATKADVDTAGQQISIVRIGDKAWLKQGTSGFIAVPVAAVSTLTDAFAPEKLFASFKNQPAFASLTAVGTETKNGVQATHYHVDDRTPLPPGSKSLPPGAMGDVWVSEDGYLVALEFSGAATDVAGQGTIDSMKIEVSHINDAGLEIQPPG